MASDDNWFRHKGRWPLRARWPQDLKVECRSSARPALSAMAGHTGSAPKSVAGNEPESGRATQILTTSEAAKVVRLSPRTLERLRVSGEGPRYIKAGPGKRAKVLYRESDLTAWLEQFSFGSTSEYSQPND